MFLLFIKRETNDDSWKYNWWDRKIKVVHINTIYITYSFQYMKLFLLFIIKKVSNLSTLTMNSFKTFWILSYVPILNCSIFSSSNCKMFICEFDCKVTLCMSKQLTLCFMGSKIYYRYLRTIHSSQKSIPIIWDSYLISTIRYIYLLFKGKSIQIKYSYIRFIPSQYHFSLIF